MDGYIKKSEAVDVIVKYPYNIAGKTATAIKMIEDLPSADVVPKREVDYWKQQAFHACMNNGCLDPKIITHFENAVGHDDPTGEEGADRLETAISYVKAEVGKLQNELVIWKQNRFNLFQRLECYKMARQKVASEIFAEIDEILFDYENAIQEKYRNAFETRFAELKKKYAEIEVEN